MNIRKVYREKNRQEQQKVSGLKTSKTPTTLNKLLNSARHTLTSPQPQIRSSDLSPDPTGIYKEFEKKLTETQQSLLNNFKLALSPDEDKEQLKLFHKSSNFIDRKEKIKQNVKNHKFQSCEKLLKVKDIIEKNKDSKAKEFITQDDVVNGEAMQFLQMNKRKFGEGKLEPAILWQRKKSVVGVKKLNGRNSSLPEFFYIKVGGGTSRHKEICKYEKKKIESDVAGSVKKYILDEMKKLWPPDTQLINEKKRKILNVKIAKLQSELEEGSKGNNENKTCKGMAGTIKQKIKMDKMVTQHFKRLRKNLIF